MREPQERAPAARRDTYAREGTDEHPRRYGEPVTQRSSRGPEDQNGDEGYGGADALISPIASSLTAVRGGEAQTEDNEPKCRLPKATLP